MIEGEYQEKMYKILLLGDSMVGKTCFLMKYTDNTFQDVHMSTIGMDYRYKKIILNNKKVIKVQIWDTAGQDRFRAITKNYYKGADGIMLLFDTTNVKSFENIKNWVVQIRDEAPPNIPIFLIGNKIDLEKERKISKEDGEKLAKELNISFYEASAMQGINVEETFQKLSEEMFTCYDNKTKAQGQKLKTLSKLDKKKNRCGCIMSA